MDMTVKDGVRWSAANAYLKPAMRRPNLEVRTHALATRVLFEGRARRGRPLQPGRRSSTRSRARPRGDPVAAARSTRRSS